ncbi:MAG: hypothetical protein ACP5VN_04460 [Acidobacteriota bacterium]
MLRDHFLSLLAYSLLVSLFFAVLYHREPKAMALSAAKTLAWMVLGSLLFAFLMFWTGP